MGEMEEQGMNGSEDEGLCEREILEKVSMGEKKMVRKYEWRLIGQKFPLLRTPSSIYSLKQPLLLCFVLLPNEHSYSSEDDSIAAENVISTACVAP